MKPRAFSHAMRRDQPRGFTLLEVLLSLALVSLLLVALGMTIDVQLRLVNTSRGNVEEAQLARVLLHRIAADLRGAVPYDLLDIKKLVDEAASAAASAVESGQLEVGGEQDDQEGGASQDAGDAAGAGEADADSTAAVASETSARIPGVYGGADWLEVDVSRLPRLDQFEGQLAATGAAAIVDRLSDIKTVSYSVLADEEAGGEVGSGGLVRREVDRAATLYATEQGTTSTDFVEPIAPEVASLAFAYWDGADWVEEWDTGEMGGLPRAIEVILTLRRSDSTDGLLTAGADAGALGDEGTLAYRLVVHLPAAPCTACQTYESEIGELGVEP